MADGRTAPAALASCAAAVALGALLLTAAPAAGQAVERRLAVAVLDADGAPAAGLGAGDFVVREDGVRREVLRVERDSERLQIALLVDTSQAAAGAVGEFRNGLRAFLEALDAGHRAALIGFGGRPRILASTTAERAPLLAAANGIFATAGSAAYLLDALEETATGFIKRAPARPAMVVLATEGLDHSHATATPVERALQEAAATVHTVVMVGSGLESRSVGLPTGFDPLRENRGLARFDGLTAQWRIDRDRILQRGPGRSGGRRRDVRTPSGVTAALRAVAAELQNRYLVVYAAPDALVPPERVDVRMARDDLTARGLRVN